MRVSDQKIGTFMVAVGSIIEHAQTGEILVLRRTDAFHFGEWEVPYGRIDQGEELLDALSREVFEETGLTEFTVEKVLRLWHIYRGEKNADNEVYGTTFHLKVTNPEIKLSNEHSEYRWVKPIEAVELIKVPGIKADVEHFLQEKNQIIIADTTDSITLLPTHKKYQPNAKK